MRRHVAQSVGVRRQRPTTAAEEEVHDVERDAEASSFHLSPSSADERQRRPSDLQVPRPQPQQRHSAFVISPTHQGFGAAPLLQAVVPSSATSTSTVVAASAAPNACAVDMLSCSHNMTEASCGGGRKKKQQGGEGSGHPSTPKQASSSTSGPTSTSTADPAAAPQPLLPPLTVAQCKAAIASLHAKMALAERLEKKATAAAASQAALDDWLDRKLRGADSLMLKFNVGGERFVVPRANLRCCEEGSFFEVVQRCYNNNKGSSKLIGNDDGGGALLDRDETGAIFIDRDPSTFRIIMNYVRGYKGVPNLTLGLAHRLLSDARFYQLNELAAEMNFYIAGASPTPAPHQLAAPGAGVNLDRTRLRAVYNVCPVGDRLLLSGRHSVSFLVKRAEYVGIGVVSDECVAFDSEFHKGRNCCVYYMTGITYTNFPHHRKEESSEKFGAGDVVTVVLDMQNKVVEYRVKGTVRCYSCASAVRLRFAVVIKFDSEVTIVDSTTDVGTHFRLRKPNEEEADENQPMLPL